MYSVGNASTGQTEIGGWAGEGGGRTVCLSTVEERKVVAVQVGGQKRGDVAAL